MGPCHTETGSTVASASTSVCWRLGGPVDLVSAPATVEEFHRCPMGVRCWFNRPVMCSKEPSTVVKLINTGCLFVHSLAEVSTPAAPYTLATLPLGQHGNYGARYGCQPTSVGIGGDGRERHIYGGVGYPVGKRPALGGGGITFGRWSIALSDGGRGD